tara:strand:+ start:481 stop:2544 length:2064 start_codon:yes stop_codon:yes gene_type:complete
VIKQKIDFHVWLSDLTYTGQDTQSLGADTFPLGVGCIATYAESIFDFTTPIRIFRYPEKLNQALVVEGLPDILGFSNYMWNSELSLSIARCLKEINPEIVIIIGGPNYPIVLDQQREYLIQHPEIDFYVPHEGEVCFTEILKGLTSNNMDVNALKGQVASVHSVDANGKFTTGSGHTNRVLNLDQIPSPYLSGKFDEFFDGRLWPLIQTKRGCPFKCTYCTEGLDYYTKISRFSTTKIQSEIKFIGAKMSKVREQGGRSDLYIADSNFGMYKEDLETAKALASSQSKYGWPDHINASTGKNQKETVLEIAKTVNGQIVLSGSVQSLDANVLDNIQRKNISPEQLMNLAKEANNVDANSYCEIILCLPGETRDSHFDTLRTIINAGFNKVIPYQLMILNGSELGSNDTIEKFGLECRSRVLPRAYGKYEILGRQIRVADIEDVCISSNSMSYQDYLECRWMHLVITIFHNDIIFNTVLNCLKKYNIPEFRWLELISESIVQSKAAKLFEDFQNHTEGELWGKREELEEFIQTPGTIEKYINGEIGFNLLYTFKAEALSNHLPEVLDAMLIATRRLLAEQGLDQDKRTLGLFNESILWDGMRATNIIKRIDSSVTGDFSYNIPKFLNDSGKDEISSYLLSNPINVNFELSEVQKDYVSRNLAIFGDDTRGIGRLMSNAHSSKLLRDYSI